MKAIVKVNQGSYLANQNGKLFEVVNVLGGEKRLYTLNIDGIETQLSEKEIIIVNPGFELISDENIREWMKEENEHVAQWLELDIEKSQLKFETINDILESINAGLEDDKIFSFDEVMLLICNLESKGVMQDLLDGDIETFDPWYPNIFNDGYWDISEELNLNGEQDNEDFEDEDY